MPKEVTCEVLKEYGEIPIDETSCIKISEIKWNGRMPKGYDIRKFQKEDEKYLKGITIPYDSIEDLVEIFISNNLCSISKLENILDKAKKKLVSNDDLDFMFKKMNEENQKYSRDKYGKLRDKNNRIVISSRRKRR